MVNQIISAARYNDLQGRIATLLGVGAGDKGYNNTVSSTAVPRSDIVEAVDMNNLFTDFEKVYVHQTGALPVTISRVDTTNDITEALHAAYESLIVTLETNRFDIDESQDAIEAGGVNSIRTTIWGGTSLPQTINHTVTVNFGTPNARRCFFNAGGELRFNAELIVDTGVVDPAIVQKNIDWRDMLSNMETIKFGRAATTHTGTSNVRTFPQAIGNEDLTTSYQTIFYKTGDAEYIENEYRIRARLNNDSEIQFDITFADLDEGTGGADEYVAGTLSSSVSHRRADGDYVSNPSPTYTKTSDL